jgi:PleD family two-component response regulator
MAKGRILIVEDDFDISNMLRIYFSGQGYDVMIAPRGGDAFNMARNQLPHLIILDIMLPDMDGYAVCRQLRQTIRTSHIPIIFLTQKDERSDRIAGLELGADDYITKPFDIEELKLRVQNAITRAQIQNLSDPRSGLPSSRLIEDELRKLMRSSGWVFMDAQMEHYNPFKEVYGFVAGDEVLRFTGLLIREVVDEFGSSNDFIGHPGSENFVIITTEAHATAIKNRLKSRFAEEVKAHYSFIDRERGYIVSRGPDSDDIQTPLMTLAVGVVSSTQDISDIREITELAAESRRNDKG